MKINYYSRFKTFESVDPPYCFLCKSSDFKSGIAITIEVVNYKGQMFVAGSNGKFKTIQKKL